VLETAHPVYPQTLHVSREDWTEPVPPQPHRFMADVDPAFKKEILNVAQRQREANVHHHYEADHLR
jgi:hypothetical protein